ncbi:DUF2889 domain-containing protein [Rhodococcus qingshengii]|uniref:DUF2889 domain-containing protein n=1 Tax=Rhodococcus TaxID=1827 RepID=UPI00071C5F0D|nr:hypothetical protein AOT96_31830 [Rhodococcus sp. 008]KSU70599.1 hypothetical protein AS032_27020 [Rhodococcus qingshengii]SCC64173.1 Protein of unknown function [Rhodococcus qingshengii]
MTDDGPRRRSRRTKCLEVEPEGGDSFTFTASLLDESFHGDYEVPGDSRIIHHFGISGRINGNDLHLTALDVEAKTHPFPQCPFIIPASMDLIGHSLMSGWRRRVLDRLGGSAGCTHVTTLLLGLSEVTTLIYFQRMNRTATYGPDSRASGEWIGASLDFAPQLGGACHALAPEGAVIRQAERFRSGRDTPAT